MRYQLVMYEGVGPDQKETVVSEGKNVEKMYDERDRLNAGCLSLSVRRHGLRPIAG